MNYLDALDLEAIDNVFLYVADDVRYDYLPADVGNMGVDTKMIAGSTVSPTSFATILSGLYYPQHGVSDFDAALPEDVPNLLHAESHRTAFCNTINHPPFNSNPTTDDILATTLRVEDTSSDVVESVEPPFVVVERGRGGHAPYGEFDGNGTEYFRERGTAPLDQYAREYREGISRDVEWFHQQVSTIEERGLAENTLIIYASDHGELLGENGNVGHNGPVHRSLVETPCVFIHPSLENASLRDTAIHHVDLLPTIQSATGLTLSRDGSLPGRDLTSESPRGRGPCYYRKSKFDRDDRVPTVTFAVDSVWDAFGGYIFPQSSTVQRVGAGVWSLLSGPKARFRRRHALRLLRAFTADDRRAGTPNFSPETGRELLREVTERSRPRTDNEQLDVQKERLEELGYLE